jgi:hypothetical protein
MTPSVNLPGVYSGPNLEVERTQPLPDPFSRLDGPSWSVENGQNAVTCTLYELSSMLVDCLLRQAIMTVCYTETSVKRSTCTVRP